MCEFFSTLLGDIYDAAINPGLWPHALGRVGQFAGADLATIVEKDVVSGRSVTLHSGGELDLSHAQISFEGSQRLTLPMGSIPDHGNLLRGAHLASAVIHNSERSATVLSIFRRESDGPIDAEAHRKLLLIVPHLRRALHISETIDAANAAAASLSDTLDSFSAGIFLLDEAQTIAHLNTSGRAMVTEGNVVRSIEGRLAACVTQSDQVLRAMVASMNMIDIAVAGAGLARSLIAGDGTHHTAHMMQLSAVGHRRGGRYGAATLILFVHHATPQPGRASEAVGAFYKLTPSELRVLQTIVQTGGTPEVAQALGVGESTVRTHLQRVFSKTGTRRQADLVKLVAEFSHSLMK
jgi:DNA-binding CsgD family transcriptional regulator